MYFLHIFVRLWKTLLAICPGHLAVLSVDSAVKCKLQIPLLPFNIAWQGQKREQKMFIKNSIGKIVEGSHIGLNNARQQ